MRKNDPKAVYNTQQWRRLAAGFLKRNPYCAWCAAQAKSVDHIRAVAAGGEPFNPGNLQALCLRCHGIKTQRDDARHRSASFGLDGWRQEPAKRNGST